MSPKSYKGQSQRNFFVKDMHYLAFYFFNYLHSLLFQGLDLVTQSKASFGSGLLHFRVGLLMHLMYDE